MKYKHILIILTIVILALVVKTFITNDDQVRNAIRVEMKEFGVIVGYGKVKSLDEQLLVASGKGRVRELYVTEGDNVKKDDLLYRIVPEQYEQKEQIKNSERKLLELSLKEKELGNKLLLLELDSKISNLKVQKELAEKYFSKQERLLKKGVISSYEFDKLKQELELVTNNYRQQVKIKTITESIFKEQISASEEKIKVFDRQFELEFPGKHEVRANTSGVVQDIYVRNGEFVDIGKEILNIVGGEDVKVVLEIPQSKASEINNNDVAYINYSGNTTEATVYNISTKVNSGVVSITLDPLNQEVLKKYINHSISGRIHTDSQKKVLAVKYSPIFGSQRNVELLVRNDKGDIEERNVRFGKRQDNFVEVLSGLKLGEEIIIQEETGS